MILFLRPKLPTVKAVKNVFVHESLVPYWYHLSPKGESVSQIDIATTAA